MKQMKGQKRFKSKQTLLKFRKRSINISLDYPRCTMNILSVYDTIKHLTNSSSYDVWIKAQFIIILENEDKKVFKTYHILCGDKTETLFYFLSVNSDIIESEGVTQKFKIIYCEAQSQYIRQKLKGQLVVEIKKDYFIIDFENMPDDSEFLIDEANKNYDYLREENFEDLNEHYLNMVYAATHEDKSAENVYPRIPSKMTLKSSDKDGIIQKDLSIIELALLETNDLEIHPIGKAKFLL